MSEQVAIPQEIRDAYYPEGIESCHLIPGGEVNFTFFVIDVSGRKTILQRLSPIYSPVVGEDYEMVAGHLRNEGWEMAEPLRANDGNTYMDDGSGRLWRAFSYIESTPGSELEGDLRASTASGGLLGTLHKSLASLDYEPKFRRNDGGPDRRMERLHALLPKLRMSDRKLAAEMIALSGQDTIDDEPSQIIHADPRIGNVLFRNGKPFTFIDWDGYRRANPLVDVGDLLQSTAGEVLTKGAGSCSAAQLYPILDSYYSEAAGGANRHAFDGQALAAARVVALDLGIRHLIDSVEDRYFVWDSSRFGSRLEFNIYCAQRQRQVYEVLSQSR